MNQARSWLPLDVVTREPVTSKISQAVADWSARWFVRTRVTATRFSAQAAVGQVESGWRGSSQSLAIKASPAAAGRLLDAALDARIELLEITVADRRLLDLVEISLFDDLLLQVQQALGIVDQRTDEPLSAASPYGQSGGLRVILTDTEGSDLLTLAIPYEVLLPHCITSLGQERPTSSRLESLGSAVGASSVAIEAKLGSVEVPLKDLGDLAPGDVLVLDKTLEGDLDICLAGSDRLVARARLTQVDGQVALILQA